MKILNIAKEWNFVAKEITSFNKGGTEKGYMLFQFQILLDALSKAKTIKEKQILISFYKKRKVKYLLI